MGSAKGMLRVVALLLLLALPAFAPSARADGCFFKGATSYEPPPAIPAQRALLVHRDGVEHLLVESRLDAEGQTFGWIVPVPAKPTEVRAGAAHVLDALDLATAPRVESGADGIPLAAAGALGLLMILGLRIFVCRARGTTALDGRIDALVVGGLLSALAWLALATAMPTAGSGGGGSGGPPLPIAGVHASATERIGNYEVTVLEARSAAALDDWLRGAGLAPLPPAGAPVVEALVAEGWRFVALRLVREAGAVATPHPLQLTFPSERPVYPMRLTALAGATTQVRLYVVTDEAVKCAPLASTYRGPVGRGVRGITGGLAYVPVATLGPRDRERRVAHPDLQPLLREGAFLTRLEGAVPAWAMVRDFLPEPAGDAWRETVIRTTEAAWHRAASVALALALAALALLALLPEERIPPLRASGPSFGRWVFVVLAGAGVAASAIRFVTPTVPAASLRERRGEISPLRVTAALERADPGAAGDAAAYEARAAKALASVRATDDVDGGPLPIGDGLGEFRVVMEARGPVVRLRFIDGTVADFPWTEIRSRAAR